MRDELEGKPPWCRENVCPQCRKPMQSRRDCKVDRRFDCIVSMLYDNVQQYEDKVRQRTDSCSCDDACSQQSEGLPRLIS